MKQNIYDNKIFFDEYTKMRKEELKGISANDLVEIPTIRSMLPNLEGKKILDLGCGYGDNCKYFIKQGASYVLGIDISQNMINLAKKENKDKSIDFKIMPMEDISKIKNKFDIIVSSLAIHYVKDFDKLCKDVYNLLNDKGYFIFSQEHPLTTSPILTKEHNEKHLIIKDKNYYLLSDYNRNGKRIFDWNHCDVEKYHRNFSKIINTLIKNKFTLEEIKEPTPTEEMIKKVPKLIRQYDKPYFIFIRLRK